MKKIIYSVLLLCCWGWASSATADPGRKKNNSLTGNMNRLNSCIGTFNSSPVGSSNCFTGNTLAERRANDLQRSQRGEENLISITQAPDPDLPVPETPSSDSPVGASRSIYRFVVPFAPTAKQ